MKKALFILIFFPLLVSGQSLNKDSSLSIPLIQINYGYLFPGGDLAGRFGVSSSIGPSFMLKTRNNWMLGGGFNYIFGNEVKQDSMFHGLKTTTDEIIDGNGAYAQVYTYERGLYPVVYAGKFFQFKSKKNISGIYMLLGGGFFQHKIRIDNPLDAVPQLRGDYRKGYDRLTNGAAVSECIGYYYLGQNKVLSFYAGFEFMQAFTKCRRDYNFDDMAKDDKQRLDMLSGFKVGWILPIYKKKSQTYYFY